VVLRPQGSPPEMSAIPPLLGSCPRHPGFRLVGVVVHSLRRWVDVFSRQIAPSVVPREGRDRRDGGDIGPRPNLFCCHRQGFPGAIVQRSGGPRATALLLALGGKHVQGVHIRQIDCWYGKYHCSELALKVVTDGCSPTQCCRCGSYEPPIGSEPVWCRPTDTPFGSYNRSGNAVSSVRESRRRIRRPFASWPSGSRRRLPGGPGATAPYARLASVRRPAPERRTRSPHRAPS
jgi:hypothetical protein